MNHRIPKPGDRYLFSGADNATADPRYPIVDGFHMQPNREMCVTYRVEYRNEMDPELKSLPLAEALYYVEKKVWVLQ